LTAKFWFEANELDENNWVVDFGGLKKLKSKMEDMFDHTTVISRDDPALPLFEDLAKKDIVVLNVMENGVGIERFAEWCWSTANDHVQEITNGRCRCVKVEVFEHEKNSAIYEVGNISVPQLTDKQKEQLTEQVENINANEGAVVNTNKNKLTNKWVDPKSTNVWGL
jgi:6-pyruvoyltetrahydropterin/6-carboxytetrahydropterin synthase